MNAAHLEAVARYAGPLDDGALPLREERGNGPPWMRIRAKCMRPYKCAQAGKYRKNHSGQNSDIPPQLFRVEAGIGALGVGCVRVRGSKHHDIRRQDAYRAFSHDKPCEGLIERSFSSSRCFFEVASQLVGIQKSASPGRFGPADGAGKKREAQTLSVRA